MERAWADERLDDLASRVDARFDTVDRRFDAIDRRFDAVDARFIALDARIDARFDSLQRLIIQVGGGMIASVLIATIGILAS